VVRQHHVKDGAGDEYDDSREHDGKPESKHSGSPGTRNGGRLGEATVRVGGGQGVSVVRRAG
jgi:hypothetical protein